MEQHQRGTAQTHSNVQQGTNQVFTVSIQQLCAWAVRFYPGHPEIQYPGEKAAALSGAVTLQMAKGLSMKTELPIIFRWSCTQITHTHCNMCYIGEPIPF